MPYARFQAYNFAGGIGWVLSCVWAGFLLRQHPVIKDNFGLVTIGIIVVSCCRWRGWPCESEMGK